MLRAWAHRGIFTTALITQSTFTNDICYEFIARFEGRLDSAVEIAFSIHIAVAATL